jgi:hypothetical protein
MKDLDNMDMLAHQAQDAYVKDATENTAAIINSIGKNTDKDAVLLSGLLLKEDTTGLVRSWRKRWFSIQEDQLLYWKDMPKRNTLARKNPPKGSISLRTVTTVEPDFNNKRKHVFLIATAEMVHYFQGDSEGIFSMVALTVCQII